jgi:adenine-specific DNA-methyltransferase
MKGLKPHKFAAIWPKRSPMQHEALKAMLLAVGQKQPIIRLGNEIIDGRQRYDILSELKIKPVFKNYEGDRSDAGIMQAIVSYNGGRHLEKSQRGMIAAELLPEYEKIAAERKRDLCRAAALRQHGRVQPEVAGPNGQARDEVAKIFAVGTQTVSDCKLILKSDRALAGLVKLGEMNVARAKRLLQRKEKARHSAIAAKSISLTNETYNVQTGDCRRILPRLPDESIELCFADPPYGIGEKYHGFDDSIGRGALMKIIRGCCERLPRVLTPTGSVFMMMSSRYAADVGAILQDVGLHRQDTIIWAHSFGAHNAGFWTDCYRVIHHFTRHPSNFTFNWQDENAYIPSWRGENGDSRREGLLKMPGNVWGVWTDRNLAMLVDNSPERIPDKIAPNQLPVKLVERVVLIASNPGDRVLDPFHGTGTTARACLTNARRYTGIEIDAEVARRSELWTKSFLARNGGQRAQK